ncbi:MAG: hypothetical protein VCD00_07070 [Candidatus Hydrogenedentota bacterium]
MRSARLLVLLTCCCVASLLVFAESEIDWHSIAAQGDLSMKAYHEAIRKGDQETAHAEKEKAQAAFAEVAKWALTIAPERLDDPEAARRYGKTLELARQYDLAARGYTRAWVIDPEDEDSAVAAARNCRKSGPSFFEEALDILRAVLRDDTLESKPSSEANAEMGRIFHEMKLIRLAQPAYVKAKESDPTSIVARLGLAIIDISEGRLVEGNSALNQLTGLDEIDARFLDVALPDALSRLDKRQIAIPGNADAHAAYAQLLDRAGRSFEALTAIEHAVMLDNSQYVWYNLKGGIAYRQGMANRAITAYTKSLEMNSDQPVTRQMLVRLQSGQ